MHGSFLGGIMIGVGKATSSRGANARVAYFLGDERLGITETGWVEHR
jgi:hypothetical protein